jgi:hypothetical protein
MEGFEKYLFRWDEIPRKDDKRLREFIIHNYVPKLSRTAQIEKLNANTIKISDEKNTVFLVLDTEKGRVTVKINDKTDEFIVKKEKEEKGDKEKYYIYPTNPLQGPGKSFVGYTGIVLTAAYLFLFSVILIYSLVQFWPSQTSAFSSVNSSNSSVTFFQWEFSVSDEGRLFLIVALAGALGSLVHALRSFYWYVGHRELILSWLAMYILLPVAGAILGLIFYIAIRGGLFPQATIQQTSPFGFAALSALVGLFSVQAVLKLQNIAETVFTKAGEGQESRPQERSKDDAQGKKGGEG